MTKETQIVVTDVTSTTSPGSSLMTSKSGGMSALRLLHLAAGTCGDVFDVCAWFIEVAAWSLKRRREFLSNPNVGPWPQYEYV